MKKKIMFIITVAAITALAVDGTAFAANNNKVGDSLERADATVYGRSIERESGQRLQ